MSIIEQFKLKGRASETGSEALAVWFSKATTLTIQPNKGAGSDLVHGKARLAQRTGLPFQDFGHDHMTAAAIERTIRHE